MSRYARALQDTTALRLSAASIVSENVREIRARQKADYLVPVAPDFYRQLQQSVARDKARATIEEINHGR